MKRLALLLGSLLVVSAAASAKEVVPAPVVVQETPVQVVEKEVIVYREKAPEWRPNGNIGVEYRYYGKTEGQADEKYTRKDETFNKEAWNGHNKYSRIQMEGNINLTENQKFEYRLRYYNELDKQTDRRNYKDDEARLRYYYDHGNLGDSKVDLTSRIQYKTYDHDQEIQYMGMFQFADYLFDNDYVKTTNFSLNPYYQYSWKSTNNDDYTNTLGLELKTYHQLPLNFGLELNLYASEHFYGQRHKKAGNTDATYKHDTELAFEAYLYNTVNLYTVGDVAFDFNFEGGYDPYTWKHKGYTVYGENDKKDHVTYELYMSPNFTATYQATKFVTLTAGVGAEYRDWTRKEQHNVSHWRWQPYAFTGFNVTF